MGTREKKSVIITIIPTQKETRIYKGQDIREVVVREFPAESEGENVPEEEGELGRNMTGG